MLVTDMFVYIHHPKTGGTFVTTMLMRAHEARGDVVQTAYAPAEPAPMAVAQGGYVVQIGAFSDPVNAQRVRQAVASVGPVDVDVRRAPSGAELFRVRVGPWSTMAEAEAARRALADLGYAESVVTAR